MELNTQERIATRSVRDWLVFVLPERLDSLEHAQFSAKIQQSVQGDGKNVAIDLGSVRFISLPSIKFISKLASDLSETGGTLALVSASEKIKRQFDVYGSLDQVRVVRRQADL